MLFRNYSTYRKETMVCKTNSSLCFWPASTSLKAGILFLTALVFIPFSMPLAGQTTETYTSPGEHSFTVPAGVTEITVEAWGGGGGAGKGQGNDAGGGGGGGAFASRTIAVSAGQLYSIVVGAGGAGATGDIGSTGGNSIITLGGSPMLQANGGSPGNGRIGGAGGTTSSGTGIVSYAGGDGGSGHDTAQPFNRRGGGGGGSAFSDAPGGNGQDGGGNSGGAGGDGEGDGGSGVQGNDNTGNPGNAPGGGGGGGGAGGNGGDGANGQIIIHYTTIDLRVYYLNLETNPSAQTLRPWFRIHNEGSEEVALSDLTFRYWFTSEPPGQDIYVVDYAAVGSSNVLSSFNTIDGERYL